MENTRPAAFFAKKYYLNDLYEKINRGWPIACGMCTITQIQEDRVCSISAAGSSSGEILTPARHGKPLMYTRGLLEESA